MRTVKCNYQDFRDLTSAETAFHVIKKEALKIDFKEDNTTNLYFHHGVLKCMWQQNMKGDG